MRNLWILLLFQISFTSAQIIPAERTTNWDIAGYPGDLPVFSNTVNVKDFGAVADGITNDYDAIRNALHSLGDQPGIVYFPEGSYLIKSGIYLKNNTVLRGSCNGLTFLKFDLIGSAVNCINIEKNQTGKFSSITAGFSRDTSVIVTRDSAFGIGDYAEIRQQNGSWDTNPASWAAYAVGQIVQVKAVSGNKITIEHPLRITLDPSLNPEIRRIEPIINAGIEDIKIERTDAATPAAGYNINLKYAVKCWIKGVESAKSAGSHIMADACSQIEITGCYIHHAFAYDGSGTRGYGVTLIQHTGECLIENTVFRALRHAMMVKQGANGNVFGYNYSLEPTRSEIPQNAGGDISVHGHYPYSNLFEGNIVQTIYIDQTWGPAGPFNTFFRNRAELYGIIMTGSDYQNFVGNEVTNKGLLYGRYSLKGANNFVYGNNIKGTISPAGTNQLNDTSLYRTNFSDFWTLSSTPPPTIGIPNTIGNGTIPAKHRYLNGLKLTVSANTPCVVTAVENNDPEQKQKVILYPNPFSKAFNIRFYSDDASDAIIKMFNTMGKEIYSDKKAVIKSFKNEFVIDPGHLSTGLYFITVQQGGYLYSSPLHKVSFVYNLFFKGQME